MPSNTPAASQQYLRLSPMLLLLETIPLRLILILLEVQRTYRSFTLSRHRSPAITPYQELRQLLALHSKPSEAKVFNPREKICLLAFNRPPWIQSAELPLKHNKHHHLLGWDKERFSAASCPKQYPKHKQHHLLGKDKATSSAASWQEHSSPLQLSNLRQQKEFHRRRTRPLNPSLTMNHPPQRRR